MMEGGGEVVVIGGGGFGVSIGEGFEGVRIVIGGLEDLGFFVGFGEEDLEAEVPFASAFFIAGAFGAPGFAEEVGDFGGEVSGGGFGLGEGEELVVGGGPVEGVGGFAEGVGNEDEEHEGHEGNGGVDEEFAFMDRGAAAGGGFDADEGVRAELDFVFGTEFDAADDAGVVEEGAGGGEVFDVVVIAIADDDGVFEGDGGVGESEVGAGRASEDGFAGGGAEVHTGFDTFDDFEEAVHRYLWG